MSKKKRRRCVHCDGLFMPDATHRMLCSDECQLRRWGINRYLKAKRLGSLPEPMQAVWDSMSEAEKGRVIKAPSPKKRSLLIGHDGDVPIWAPANPRLDAKLKKIAAAGSTYADAQRAETLAMLPRVQIPAELLAGK